jgi:pimeloyl-ACP methyl ester carboxylesterase
MPRVKVNGWRFLYRRAGKGPDVVMLPGAAHAAFSRPLFDALSAEFRVTFYGARGGERESHSSADAADDLRGLHEKLGLAPSYLVAHNDAASVALHTAVLYPDVAAGLVLVEPCLPEPRMDNTYRTRSGLTTRRILLIEHPIVAFCKPQSPGLSLCRFLAGNLARCKLVAASEDSVRLAARIHEQVQELAGANPAATTANARSSRPGPRGIRCRLAPEAGDGHAITRWVTRLSAWGL